MSRPPPASPLFPYTTLFRSSVPANSSELSTARVLAFVTVIVPVDGVSVRPLSLPTLPVAPAKDSGDRKSTRLNSSHRCISYAVFCLKKKKIEMSEKQRQGS